MGFFEIRAAKLLAKADIRINGTRPRDLQGIKNPEAFARRVLTGGRLAFCESYMDGEWDCEDQFDMYCRLFKAKLNREIKGISGAALWAKSMFNQQTKKLSLRVAEQHYDLGNDFYAPWLDKSMTYSCARWKGVVNLDDAQTQKRRLIARKGQVEPGMTALDIGCGWAALMILLAQECGAVVTGTTLSKEQAAEGRRRCKAAGVDARILEKDYRDEKGVYDRIFSVGMAEHVGVRNLYKSYFPTVARCLAPGGLFVYHSIVGEPAAKDPFMDKYVFPGGELPAVWQVAEAAQRSGLILVDWEDFGEDYCHTLLAWRKNFTENLPRIRPHIGSKAIEVFGSIDRLERAWKGPYLCGNAAAFHENVVSVGQGVFSKERTGSVYEAVRP